jgi:hypothetical protein
VTADLARQLSLAVSTGDARADLTATAHAYRAFVLANPNGYGLLFAHLSPDLQPDPAAIADLARPIVEAMSAMVGPDDALPAARTFVAWAHGFVSMEVAGAFRLGGGLDEAYDSGVGTILDGVSGRASPAAG